MYCKYSTVSYVYFRLPLYFISCISQVFLLIFHILIHSGCILNYLSPKWILPVSSAWNWFFLHLYLKTMHLIFTYSMVVCYVLLVVFICIYYSVTSSKGAWCTTFRFLSIVQVLTVSLQMYLSPWFSHLVSMELIPVPISITQPFDQHKMLKDWHDCSRQWSAHFFWHGPHKYFRFSDHSLLLYILLAFYLQAFENVNVILILHIEK